MRSAAASEHPGDPASSAASARAAELFERHGRMVYGICRAMLRDVHEAEDATQQVFLSAHRAVLAGAVVRDPGAWLAAIARNECRGRVSAGMRRPLQVPDDELANLPQIRDDVERRLWAGALRDALAELPERQREAVVLRYVYGLRYGEVSTALGLSRPATEALLFRARRAMRVRLRHAVGAALVVPLSVREELALALPGFEAHAGSSAAAVSVTGGLLAKLVSAPAAAKVATATAAVATVGVVGSVSPDRPGDLQAGAPAVREAPSTASALGSPHAERESGRSGRDGETEPESDDDARGERPGEAGHLDESSGSGPGRDEDDSRGDDRSGTSGGNGAETSTSRSPAEENGEPERDSGPSSGSGSGDTSESSGSSGPSGSGSSDTSDDDRERSGPGSLEDDDS